MVVKRARPTDRISNLPCTTIEQIISYLPLRDAVRTCVLSSEWKYKWLSIQNLIFDEHFISSVGGVCSPELAIYHVLAYHKVPIVKFFLEYTKLEIRHDVNNWLYILLKHRSTIQDLTLKLWNGTPRYLFPRYLFKFKHLTYLHLSYGEIILPPTFKGFSSLVTLVLTNVTNSFNVLNCFIDKCPKLMFLDVKNMENSKGLRLDIKSPAFKSFYFHGISSSIVLESGSLEELVIFYLFIGALKDGQVVNVEEVEPHEYRGCLVMFFYRLPSIKKFVTNFTFLKFLAKDGVPRRLPHALNHLTVLELCQMDFGSLDVVSCGLCLIRSSPNLQTLEITCENKEYISERERKATIQYLKRQHKHLALFPISYSLTYVKIIGFDAILESEVETEFLKLLLLGCQELRSMVYENNAHSDRTHLMKIVEDKKSLRPASSAAVKVAFDQHP